MEYTSHISILEGDGQSVITVDDYELFDYLDDFFVEQGLEAAFISTTPTSDGQELHSIHFNPPHTTHSLLQLLSQIPASEIERVYALNRKPN
jgi:hypothetical protein